MPVQFDVQAARSHGYTDAEIADTVAKQAGFDSVSARQAGHSDTDIIKRITGFNDRAVDVDAHVADALKERAQGMTTRESIETGAGRTFDMIGKGMQQLYYGATGNEKELAALKGRAEHNTALYNPIQEAHPVATAVGESLPSMVVPIGGLAGTTAKVAGKLAITAAIPAALEYGTVEERAKRAALAASGAMIGGVVVPKAVGLAAAGVKATLKGLAGNITPEALALAARAKALGIPVNAAQLGDSKFLKTLSSQLEQMPFTGGAKSAAEQRTAFTNAVSQTFGADVNKITPEVYAAQKARLGTQFDTLAARNNLDVTPALTNKLGGIVDQAVATGADDTVRAMKNIMGRVTEQAQSTGGVVPAKLSSLVSANGQPIITAAATSSPVSTKLAGTAYSSIDSELSNIIKAGGEKGLYAKRMQTAIREAMDSSISPADQAAWTQTRTQYKNLKAVRNIVAGEKANGDIPPSQLIHALTSTEAGKEAMAMGARGTLGDLGRVGQRFVRDQIPNSGTIQRGVAMGIIGGGGYAFGADPATIAGMMVGGATAGRLMNKVMQSPKTIEALATRGISLKDLAKMPPSRMAQVVGGVAGMTATNQKKD